MAISRRPAGMPLPAIRTGLGPVAALLAVAALAWWWAAARMAGMDAGPGTALGSLGSFAGVWATMMAAMMLPSLVPTAALYPALARRGPSRMLLFAGGYLLLWSVAGIGAYGLFELGRSLFAGSLAWHSGGRWLAAGALALAAAYQLTPLKRGFLFSCRDPFGASDSSRLNGRQGALLMGLRHGGWCLGCSWALMAALFALGVMSLTWMALIAVLVSLERFGPRGGRRARLAGAGILAVLAVAVLAVPHAIPGFVVPGSPASHRSMQAMQ